LPQFIFFAQVQAQTLDKKFASTNGQVYATLQSGDSVYIGGSFTQVGLGAKGLARFKPGNTKTRRYISGVKPNRLL